MTERSERAAFHRRDGNVLAIIRPADPRRALEASNRVWADQRSGIISELEALARMNDVLSQQPYTHVGFLGEDDVIVDENEIVVGPVVFGDTIVPFDQLASVVAMVEAVEVQRARQRS